MKKMAVVFHLNDPSERTHQEALRSIQHLIEELPEVYIELVIQGDALPLVMTKHSALASEIRRLQDLGLRVAVCHRTMVRAQVRPCDLLPEMVIVPSAVAHIVQQQQEGFAYVKP